MMGMSGKPAILGGKPTFKDIVPIVKPPIKAFIRSALTDFEEILESRMITNFEYVRKLETSITKFIGVNHCVATASCTSGLMLALQALDIKDGEALIPSFTFPATAHAVHWNRLKITLVDCDPKTFNMDIEDLRERITKKSKVVIPVHIFGNPYDTEPITEIAEDHALRVVYDAAHAFGAKHSGVYVGRFGDAEVFSGSPTKAFTTVEGGLVTTNNAAIAKKIEIGRNYGHRGDYNCEMPGLSARMSELHAALGLNLLPQVASDIKKRNEIAGQYEKGLGKLPGIKFQKITANSTSTYKDFGILVESEFGLSRDKLASSLGKENVMTRKYFYPPIHMQDCYPYLRPYGKTLPNTNTIANNILCLPMFSELEHEQVDKIVGAIIRIHEHAEEIKSAVRREAS